MVSRTDIISFLERHRGELLILYELMDEDDRGEEDKADIRHRLACIDALLLAQGVDVPLTFH
jgi:hypothetical protein